MNYKEIAKQAIEKTKIKNNTGVSKIINILFKAQIDAKITHLMQPSKTLAQHEAMNMFYEGIDELLDTLVETYMGLYPLEICTEGSCMINNVQEYFTTLYSILEKERVSIKETFLQNQIDEIQQLISHTLYRIKYINT